ncbi:MAG: hypothetical protein ACXVXV_11155 [Blastococcus sp.]
MTATHTADDGAGHLVPCWCCGRRCPAADVVHLGNRPEVAVCLRCAHFLHQQARGREDARRTSPAARARDGLRAARRLVIAQRWHEKPVIGPLLRWLGPRLP